MAINDLSITQLASKKTELERAFSSLQAEILVLDLTRGNPSREQLNLSIKLDGILDDFFLLID